MANVDFSQVDTVLEGYYPQMERDLIGLLSFPSVKGEPDGPGAPFGRGIADTLDYALSMAGSLGFQPNNVDGYAGYADLPGHSQEQVGVLAHLDVVPADPKDWDSDPYAPVIREGRIIARGTMDDKGPLVAAMYGALALRDCGVQLDKTVRFIMGCDEESGMACMTHYLSQYAPPPCSFSPDASFPLIIAEKGVSHYTYTAAWQPTASAPAVLSLDAGAAANVVPAEAVATLRWTSRDTFPTCVPQGISVHWTGDDQVQVKAVGRAAHASTPEEGENGLMKLVRFLNGLPLTGGGAEFLRTIGKLYQDDLYGADLGIQEETDKGRLTSIPSMLHLDEQGAKLTGDIRFLYHRTGDEMRARLEQIGRDNGLTLTDWLSQDPLYLGKDHPLAQTLLTVYRDFTGDMTEPLMIGGGTYAKTFPNCVAFGPEKFGEPNFAHQANEFITQEALLDLAKLYARAIYALAK